MKFSIIVPLYRCSHFIEELAERLITTLEKIDTNFEIIFVNDESPENDWEIVEIVSKKDKRIKGINLSRNFGQHYAITAGLAHASGEWIIVMDGDLQDQPEEIINLYNKTKEDYKIVFAQRKERKDSFLKKLSSKLFYYFFSYLTGTKQDSSIANFGIYHQKVINAILDMRDSIRYFPTMSQWVGFKKTKIFVKHSKRKEGKSSYNLRSLFALAFNNIIAFSTKPLKLFVKFGFFIVLISVLFAIYYVVEYFRGNINVIGYTSLIISIWFLSGIIILILGVVGIYVGKTFERVKNRPNFIVQEKININ